MKRLIVALVLTLWVGFAQAQWQTPSGTVPIGRGAGVVGFGSVSPGSNGNCLTVVAGIWVSAACGSGSGITTPCAINTLVVGGGVGVIPTCAGILPTINIPAFVGGDVTSAGSSLVLTLGNIASNNDFFAGTSGKTIQGQVLWQAETTTTYGATTTFDFATFKNTKVTLTGNITTQTLSNVIVGKAGMITFIQDGTGSRTTIWNSIFKFSGGTAPVLTTTAGAVDILTYSCRTAIFCAASLLTDVK